MQYWDRLNKIARTDLPSSFSSILKRPQDVDKVRCVKPLIIYWKPRQRKKSLHNNPNSKIQLENPSRNPNPVNRQPLFHTVSK